MTNKKIDPKKALSQFLEEWEKLPPLVRANIAMTFLDKSMTLKESINRLAANTLKVDLTRRNKVCKHHEQACLIIGTMFLNLTKIADDEAEERGIDADILGEKS